MNIGFIQFAPALNILALTLSRLEELWVRTANMNLVVLPELCNSGYNFKNRQEARDSSEEIADSKFIEFLIAKAKSYDQFIVSGFNERHHTKLYNSAVLVGPRGYIGKYQKLHLFMKEKDFFEPGAVGLPTFDLGFCRMGILVCFDWIFPEVWRILGMKGVDLITHPSNLVLPGFAQRAVPVHAVTNRVFVVTANRVGEEENLSFTGMSTIADPRGEILCQASQSQTEVHSVKMDPDMARDKHITPWNHVFEDRRVDLYEDLLK